MILSFSLVCELVKFAPDFTKLNSLREVISNVDLNENLFKVLKIPMIF